MYDKLPTRESKLDSILFYFQWLIQTVILQKHS